MNRHIFCSLLLTVVFAATVAQAGGGVVEFSADAIQKGPQTPSVKAKMFVGDKRVRKEYANNGQQLVEIFDASKQHAVLLMPAKHVYMERQGSLPDLAVKTDKAMNPCQGLKEANCKKLGSESVNGRPTEKWQMIMNKEGRDQKALYWIDADRNMLVKQVLPDGTSTELRLLGKETINGRETEKWEMTATNPQGQTMRSTQWYDPELKIAIREEMPGGYMRELKNISIGAQPDTLFEIPAGYTLIKQPAENVRPAAPAR